MGYTIRTIEPNGYPRYAFTYELDFRSYGELTDAIYVLLMCPKHKHVFLVDTQEHALRILGEEHEVDCIADELDGPGRTGLRGSIATPPFPLF